MWRVELRRDAGGAGRSERRERRAWCDSREVGERILTSVTVSKPQRHLRAASVAIHDRRERHARFAAFVHEHHVRRDDGSCDSSADSRAHRARHQNSAAHACSAVATALIESRQHPQTRKSCGDAEAPCRTCAQFWMLFLAYLTHVGERKLEMSLLGL